MADLNRIYRLVVTRGPDLDEVLGFDRSFFEVVDTVTEITEMAFRFKIEKTIGKNPNSCELVITNLAEPSREEFVTGKVSVRFEAGYEDTLRLMFLGDVRHAANRKDGTEWLTEVQIADGGRAYAEAQINKSYAPKTPPLTILADLAKSFGLALPTEILRAPELQARLPAGEAFRGNTAAALTKFLAPRGFEWSVQNGALQILRFDAARPGTIRVISEDDGMIGAPAIDPPKIRAPSKRSTKVSVPKLTVQHTLYPELVPGELVEIRSRSINGQFRIEKLQHAGDTFGADWTTTIEAVSV